MLINLTYISNFWVFKLEKRKPLSSDGFFRYSTMLAENLVDSIKPVIHCPAQDTTNILIKSDDPLELNDGKQSFLVSPLLSASMYKNHLCLM